jgi:5-methylcytosine-specific restriction endonuclease McrA
LLEQHRAHYVANREELREKSRGHLEANREKRREYQRAYLQTEAGKAAAARADAARRSRITGQRMDRNITTRAVAERDGWTCYLCGCEVTQRTYTMDHVIPVSRGGLHEWGNLRCACRRCNSRKGAKTLEEYRSAQP